MTKERLRARLLEARRKMPFEEVYRASSAIQSLFIGSEFFRSAQRLSIYSSFRNEVLTDEVFRAAMACGKEVFYPRMASDGSRGLVFLSVGDLKELSPGPYDVLEPSHGAPQVAPDGLDLVVVPGVAFDVKGARLGYGKGYYDAALGAVRCPIVALAFDFQVLDCEIPLEMHDVRMSAVFTEKRVLSIRSGC